MPRINAEVRPIVAEALEVDPEHLIGWVVVGVTDQGDTLVETNARDQEHITDFLQSVVDNLPMAERA
jgi:hypothetical protein